MTDQVVQGLDEITLRNKLGDAGRRFAPGTGTRPWADLVPLGVCESCRATGSMDVRRDSPETGALAVVDRVAEVVLIAERSYQAAVKRGCHVTRAANRLRASRAEARQWVNSPDRYLHAECNGVVRFFDTRSTAPSGAPS